MKGSGETTIPNSILEKVFELILRYIALPICQDEVTIAKIRDLLLQGLDADPSTIYLQNINTSESVMAYSHLKKLELVS